MNFIRQGHAKDKIVYSRLSDLLPSEVLAEDDPSLAKPDEEEIEETTEKTRLALEKLTQSKIDAAMPVRCADKVVRLGFCFNFLIYFETLPK
jgi:SNW domain-containing protein 1